jgi:hypothetical protein
VRTRIGPTIQDTDAPGGPGGTPDTYIGGHDQPGPVRDPSGHRRGRRSARPYGSQTGFETTQLRSRARGPPAAPFRAADATWRTRPTIPTLPTVATAAAAVRACSGRPAGHIRGPFTVSAWVGSGLGRWFEAFGCLPLASEEAAGATQCRRPVTRSPGARPAAVRLTSHAKLALQAASEDPSREAPTCDLFTPTTGCWYGGRGRHAAHCAH